jgi:hypothetical protein
MEVVCAAVLCLQFPTDFLSDSTMQRYQIAVAVVALFAAGCGVNHINENEATSGWRVAGEPLQKGQQQIQEKARNNTGQLISGETITHSVDCNEGGDVLFSLSVDLQPPSGGGDAGLGADAGGRVDAGAPPGGMTPQPEVDLTAEYRDCSADGSTMNGWLDISSPQFAEFGQMAGDGEESCDCPEPTPVTYDGHLEFTGKIDGPCTIEMTAEIPPWGQPTYSGNLCGYEASEQLGQPF